MPDKHYKKVTRYINQTNLRARLVYYHVKDTIPTLAEDQTVYYKLDFHPDHKLSDWVQQQIVQQFSYVCLEDKKTIERYDKAITINGLVKNRDRHEKDGRPDANDARRYVMGWNNERKKEALISRRNKLTDDLANAAEIIERCRNRAVRLQKQFYALSRLQEHEGFTALDIAGLQRIIHKTEEQIKELSKSNNQLKALTSQLEQILAQRTTAERNGKPLPVKNDLAKPGERDATAEGIAAGIAASILLRKIKMSCCSFSSSTRWRLVL